MISWFDSPKLGGSCGLVVRLPGPAEQEPGGGPGEVSTHWQAYIAAVRMTELIDGAAKGASWAKNEVNRLRTRLLGGRARFWGLAIGRGMRVYEGGERVCTRTTWRAMPIPWLWRLNGTIRIRRLTGCYLDEVQF